MIDQEFEEKHEEMRDACKHGAYPVFNDGWLDYAVKQSPNPSLQYFIMLCRMKMVAKQLEENRCARSSLTWDTLSPLLLRGLGSR